MKNLEGKELDAAQERYVRRLALEGEELKRLGRPVKDQLVRAMKIVAEHNKPTKAQK